MSPFSFPEGFPIYNFLEGLFFHLPPSSCFTTRSLNFLFSLQIESAGPRKTSFRYYFPRLHFFGLQSLHFPLVQAFLCKTVCRKQSRENNAHFLTFYGKLLFLQKKKRREIMKVCSVSNSRDNKREKKAGDSEPRSVSTAVGLQQAFHGNKIFFL